MVEILLEKRAGVTATSLPSRRFRQGSKISSTARKDGFSSHFDGKSSPSATCGIQKPGSPKIENHPVGNDFLNGQTGAAPVPLAKILAVQAHQALFRSTGIEMELQIESRECLAETGGKVSITGDLGEVVNFRTRALSCSGGIGGGNDPGRSLFVVTYIPVCCYRCRRRRRNFRFG
jgi:hypothetical protein